MVNWRSDVNTPLRLNGLTMRSASTPSTESRSTRPLAWAFSDPKRTPLVTRSTSTSCPLGARLRDGRVAFGLQIGGHLARKQLDEARAHQRHRMAFAGEGGIGRVELGALEAFGDEDVGDDVAGAAEHGIVMTAGAGVGVRAAQAGKRGIDAELALRRNDRLRRLRPSRSVGGGELGLEQFASALDEAGQGGGAGRRHGVEVDMAFEHALVPAARLDRSGGGRQSERERPSPQAFPHFSLALRFPARAFRSPSLGSCAIALRRRFLF